MGYCTKQDLIDRVGAETLRQWTIEGWPEEAIPETDSYGIVESVVTSQITISEGNIDAALAERFLDYLPFASTIGVIPPVLLSISVDEVIYLLVSGRGSDSLKDTVYEANYQAAMNKLQRIANGDMPLLVDGRNLTVETEDTDDAALARGIAGRSSTWGRTAVFSNRRLPANGRFPR